MASSTPLPRPFHQFAAGLHEHREPLGFVQHLLSGLHRLVPSDYNSWKEIVFAGQPKVAAVFSPQNPEAATRLPAFQRHAKEHPVWVHWRESCLYHVATRWSDVEGKLAIHHTPIYEEFYRPLGVRHQVMVALEAKPSHLIYVALNRSRTPFTEQERDLLTTLQPYASGALRQIRDLHRLRSTIASFSAFVDTLSQGVLCLSPDFQIRWVSKQAHTYLRSHFGWEPNATRLPETLQQWLTKSQQRLGAIPRTFSIRSKTGRLAARVLKKQKLLYLFLESVEQQPTFDTLKTFGLTDRETEILQHVATGKSNEETAVILGISPQTVKKHLERIYSVLGVSNRTEAAVQAHAALGGSVSQPVE